MAIEFDYEIAKGSKVIVPISMSSNLKGTKLSKLIEALKEKDCDITILIADTLQQYNCRYEDAVKMGDNFLTENAEILKNIKKLRWQEYLTSKQDEFNSKRAIIETAAKKGTEFYYKMLRTQKKCAISKDPESSLLYQKEEYAAYLTMQEFDYHIYPATITPGMLCLFKEFPEVTKPQYVRVSFPKLETKNVQQVGLFKIRRHENNLSLTTRICLQNITAILSSPEISEEEKQSLREHIDSIFTLRDDQINRNQVKDPSLSKTVLVKF